MTPCRASWWCQRTSRLHWTANREVRAVLEAPSYSDRCRHVMAGEGAEAAETRAGQVVKVDADLLA